MIVRTFCAVQLTLTEPNSIEMAGSRSNISNSSVLMHSRCESLRESNGENLIDILTTGSFSYLNRLDVEFRGESENEKKKTKKTIS